MTQRLATGKPRLIDLYLIRKPNGLVWMVRDWVRSSEGVKPKIVIINCTYQPNDAFFWINHMHQMCLAITTTLMKFNLQLYHKHE